MNANPMAGSKGYLQCAFVEGDLNGSEQIDSDSFD